MPKYKHGKQTTTMDFETFKEAMEDRRCFVKGDLHRSFLAFLYWFGVRRSEALERVKEDFSIEDGRFLVINCPAKKHGRREILKAPLDLPFMDLICSQVETTKPGRRVWPFSGWTAWRVTKRVLGKRYYPHFLRLNRAVHFLDDATTTIPEMQAWFGWRQIKTIDSYLGYSKRHLEKQASRLRSEIESVAAKEPKKAEKPLTEEDEVDRKLKAALEALQK